MTIVDSGHVKQREITSGTREWADHNVNCIKGCTNDCRYCYARMMAKRFGRTVDSDWKDMVINQPAVDKEYRKLNGRVMFPSTHDITDEREVKEACFTVIGKLLEAGNEVLITTKPRLSVIKEIVNKFATFREQLQFRFTITSINNELLSFWEPNAPTFEERFTSLKYAHRKTFKTSVSVEPFLDYTPQLLINKLSPFITESIWLGPMNYVPRNGMSSEDEKRCLEIRRNYQCGHLFEIYEELRTFPLIRFKDSMTNRLNLFS